MGSQASLVHHLLPGPVPHPPPWFPHFPDAPRLCPRGRYEHPSQMRALDCSEFSCGSISLGVQVRVLTVAHEVPICPCHLSALALSKSPQSLRSSNSGLLTPPLVFWSYCTCSSLHQKHCARSPHSSLQPSNEMASTQEALPVLSLPHMQPPTGHYFPLLCSTFLHSLCHPMTPYIIYTLI